MKSIRMNWRFGRSKMGPGIAIRGLSAVLVIVTPLMVLADQQDCTRSVSRYDSALNNVQAAVGRFSASV